MTDVAATRPSARLEPLEASGENLLLRLRVGAEDWGVRFSSPDGPLDSNLDAGFVASLPVAMATASSLDCSAGVSPLLLENAREIQDILHGWQPALQPIAVNAEPLAPPLGAGRTAAFFTCGVDSFYTVLKRREEIDAVVYVHGLDLPPDDPKKGLISANFRQAAAALGLEAIELTTDIRAFSDPVCDWERIYTSAALATAGHLLASRFERMLIPATHSYLDLHPTGSHPMLDPLYSSDRLRFEHVDAISRVDKVAHLVDSPLAMSSLRVCWQRGVDGKLNCGVCAKCTRTMVNLRVVGALGRCSTLPDEFSLREMSSGKVRSRRSLTYVRENLAALEARGTDPDLDVALRRLIARGARTEAWEKSKLLARSARVAARARASAMAQRIGLR